VASVIVPATRLEEDSFLESAIRSRVGTVYVHFSDKLGGEISIPRSARSPELSFDLTFFECFLSDAEIRIGRFGIYEIQTMDFHGSYRHAVAALSNAIDLHQANFPTALAQNPEWAGRGIEGPNIANVFKRTFYQMALKFELVHHPDCAGAVLGLPEAVWGSWAHHLALPKVVAKGDYLELEGTEYKGAGANSWIATLRPDEVPVSIQPLRVDKLIRVDANDLLKRAFQDVSDHIGKEIIPLLRLRAMGRIRHLVHGRLAVSIA
jgi:hypothetical protein